MSPREVFYDTLKEKVLSHGEYEHAQSMWTMVSCLTLGDYIRLYCEIDVGLLADTYLKYRSYLHEFYGLDVAHYVSLSSYAYDAFFKVDRRSTWSTLRP